MSGPVVRTITLDFGNTLVPVDRRGLARVVERTARVLAERCGPFSEERFLDVWAEERARQFAEEVPRFREVDMAVRVTRVLARLRGMPAPPSDQRWDDAAAARLSDPEELVFAVETYSRSFVEAMPPPPSVGPLLDRLSTTHRLAVLSNWPLAVTIDRYIEAAGWARHFDAIVVSQRVGWIKPHEAIFRATEAMLGLRPDDRATTMHVGDDWAADVVGAKRAGWLAAHLSSRPEDSPLPSSERDGSVEADLELPSLDALETALASRPPRGARPPSVAGIASVDSGRGAP
ncbi:MAG TPA: HAD family hydrolase [Candidatus Dormibacteraeota bacterium]|nr:HAD family hydrolase [Candidatus Dormibacteraeota bacterium]